MKIKKRLLIFTAIITVIVCAINIETAGESEAGSLPQVAYQETYIPDYTTEVSPETTHAEVIPSAANVLSSGETQAEEAPEHISFAAFNNNRITGIPNAVSVVSAVKATYIGKVVNCRKYVNVYKSAKTSSRVLGRANKGATYTVNKAYNNRLWYQISYNGKTGYIRKSYLSVTKRVSALPVTPTPESTPLPATNPLPVSDPVPTTNPEPVATPAPTVNPVPTTNPVPETTPAPTTTPVPIVSPEPTTSPDSGVITEDTWYTIDNAQFGIDNTGNNARSTTDGINNALAWAKAQGYRNIKFAEGTYLIQCTWSDRCLPPDDGILVPSGLTLDLGSSTFKMEANDSPQYCIFGIVSQSNVTIKGGTLIGDLNEHVFRADAKSPTHEWGFGIIVSAGNDILIRGVTIKDMTGDGVILEGSYDYLSNGGRESANVRVLDCNISNCRRQGVSIVGAMDSEIAGNRIHGISGADPQFGIDVEPELDYVVTNVKVHDNTISGCSGGAISACKGSDYEIYANTCTGNCLIAVFSSNVRIYGNTINNSFIRVYGDATNITVSDNILDASSWIEGV